MSKENQQSFPKVSINWYPGHMQKTKRQIKEQLPLIDFILELVDSRIPYSSKIVGIDEIIKNKPKITLFTKSDLCDKLETGKWIEFSKSSNNAVLMVDLKEKKDIKKIIEEISKLSELLNQDRQKKGLKPKIIRGLVVGIPNVGKSTLINSLAGKKVTGVANTPGFTKSLTWLKVGGALLLDSPGILWPKFESEEVALNLAAMSAIKEEVLNPFEVAVHILKKLGAFYPNILKEYFNLDSISENLEEDYAKIGQKYGLIAKGGIVDIDRINLFIINALKSEKVKGITFDRYGK